MRNQQLTELQTKFVHYLVNGATSAVEAARLAGYEGSAIRQNASQLMRKPHVQAEIRHQQHLRLNGNLANIALNTLEEIMLNPSFPAGARVSAAIAVLDRAGISSKEAESYTKDVKDMTRFELEEYIRAFEHLLIGNNSEKEISQSD